MWFFTLFNTSINFCSVKLAWIWWTLADTNMCHGNLVDCRLGKNVFPLRVRLVAVKQFPENTYFPEMLIFRKGKCIPLFGCLGNRFPENQFRCLVRPNILRKLFYGKSIPVFDSSKHFTENTLRKSFYGKSFPVFGLWIIFTENMKCVTNSSTCII